MFDNLKSFLTRNTKSFSVAHLIGFGDINHKYSWTRQGALGEYERSLYANKAINKRAEKVGQVKFQLFDKKGELIEDNHNPWLNLLNRPNAYQTGDQFWFLAQKYHDIVGACFIVPMKKDVPFPEVNNSTPPDSLKLLRADRVEVLLSKDQDAVVGFQYHTGNQLIQYAPEEVIYHYRPDPRNPLMGESLLATASRVIETEVQIMEYQANVLRNGGRLEQILKVDGITTPESIDKILTNYQQKYAGAKNAGRPLVVGSDMSLESSGLSPSELAYLETKQAALDDIVVATGVPKTMLGLTGDETYANAEASQIVFLRDYIKPELERLTTILDWRLIPMEYDLGFIDPTPEDVDKKIKIATALHTINAVTTNEKREMFEIDSIASPEAERIFQPMNMVPLDTPKTPEPEAKQKGFNHPLKNKEFRKMYGQQAKARQILHEKLMERTALRYFDEQLARIEQKITPIKRLKGRKDLQSDLFDKTLEIQLAKQTFLPVLREIFISEAQATADTFGTTYSPNSGLNDRLTERLNLFTDSIVSTTSDQLALRIADNINEGGNRDDLVAAIRELYGDISQGRAEVIARTEVHAAVSEGHLDAYRQANFPIKIWTTVGDSVVREEHAAMDGEEQPLDGVFSNGSLVPDEPNCRCQI
jgi:HK97 family phage portal protein